MRAKENGSIAPVFYHAETAYRREVILAIADVHRDFKAETHFGRLRFGPHDGSPYLAQIGQVQFSIWNGHSIRGC